MRADLARPLRRQAQAPRPGGTRIASRGRARDLRSLRGLAPLAALCCALASAFGCRGDSGQRIVLWPEGAPGALGTGEADVPTLTAFFPSSSRANGTAAIIVPGGGYTYLTVREEGLPTVKWLNDIGIAAFLLRYRLAPRYRCPSPVDDVRRAIRLVRANATTWGLDPRRVGLVGYSAGGHLASIASTQFDNGDPGHADPVERVSTRPSFAILVYPLITLLDPGATALVRDTFFGPSIDPELSRAYSSELHVRADTSPTFLVHSTIDPIVPYEHSLLYAAALRRAGVPHELHVFEGGRHAFATGGQNARLRQWPALAAAWLKAPHALAPAPRRSASADPGPSHEPAPPSRPRPGPS